MPKLLYFYLGRRVFFSVLLLEVGLCVPVVLTQLFHYLPASAVRSGLLMPALMGTLPTAIYLALPMAVGIAVALEFSRMAADGMIAVLYSLRLSVVAVCVPATLVALIAVVFGLLDLDLHRAGTMSDRCTTSFTSSAIRSTIGCSNRRSSTRSIMERGRSISSAGNRKTSSRECSFIR